MPKLDRPSAPEGKTAGAMIADDGKEYPRRVVAGAGIIATGQGERAERVEKAMSLAAMKAHDQGITDPAEIRKLIVAARDEAMKE